MIFITLIIPDIMQAIKRKKSSKFHPHQMKRKVWLDFILLKRITKINIHMLTTSHIIQITLKHKILTNNTISTTIITATYIFRITTTIIMLQMHPSTSKINFQKKKKQHKRVILANLETVIIIIIMLLKKVKVLIPIMIMKMSRVKVKLLKYF